MKIYEIRDHALSSGRLVYRTRQLAKLVGVPDSHAKVYAYRLVQKGMAWRLSRGSISFTHDTFIIASQLIEPSYVSMHSALYLRGLIDQVPSIVEAVTTKRPAWLRDLGIRYRKISGKLFFGYERLARANSYVFVATPEKAVLDTVYFGGSPDPSVLDQLDKEKILEISEAFLGLRSYRAKKVARWIKCYVENK
jgi:predicted transcriptional regulator of viral defense system